MALTNNAPPSTMSRALPLDAALEFCKSQVIAASGYANNLNNPVTIGEGRVEGYWVVNVEAFKVSAGDETDRIFLLGSNDVAFGNGNVEMLAVVDMAAASAGRLLPTIVPPSSVVPSPGRGAREYVVPYCTQKGGFTFKYLAVYVLQGGTAPTITLTSWLTLPTGVAGN